MSKFNFDKVLQNFEEMKRTLPIVLANDSLKFFNASFVKQGWTDKSFKQWKQRQDKDTSRSILVKTGSLRNAVNTSLVKASWSGIKFSIDPKFGYGMYHNEGTDILPQRKFMGDSAALRKIQKEKIKQAMKSVWQV
jgi:FKBP-type peptidyl-prolyl cis-trans isomerase 2